MGQPFSIMVKPVGANCNLACRYCYYTEKKALYQAEGRELMADDLLELFVEQYISSQDVPEINFSWQGGEPTLAGIDFFARAVSLQKKYANGRRISNAIQTNGTRIDDRWAEFLAKNNFLIGLSLDGPQEFHDRHRRGRDGSPTFEKVMTGLESLARHKAKFNTLTVISSANVKYPLELYRFLKEICQGFIQFIPLVERPPGTTGRELGLELALPPSEVGDQGDKVTSWSLKPGQLSFFYNQIFDEWLSRDVGRVFVQFFDVALGNWMGQGGGLCQFSRQCGDAPILEYNGDLYSCDHYVYPAYRLGNIREEPLQKLMAGSAQKTFGEQKERGLSRKCTECRYLRLCGGDCPKHRFVRKKREGELSYLCSDLIKIFSHMEPGLKAMESLLRAGRPPGEIMPIMAREKLITAKKSAGRNDPCPCGSNKKFKKCCGR